MLRSSNQSSRELPVTVFIGSAAFTALHRVWPALVPPTERVPNIEPALFRATAEGSNEELEPVIVLLGDPTNPCGMIAGRRSRRALETRIGYLRLAGPMVRCLDVVYGGLRTDGSRESDRLLQAVLPSLPERVGTDVVSFNHLPDTLRQRWLPGAAQAHGTPNAHWHFDYEPGDWEQTWRRFSKKHRYNLRRARRQLNGTISALSTRRDLDTFRGAAESVTQASWLGAVGGGFQRSAVRDALDEAATDAGQWRGFLLHANNQPIAFHCGVRLGPVFHLQATAFDPAHADASPGQMLLVEMMQSLRGEGVDSIDYGFGDAPYKQRYGTRRDEERTWQIYRPAARARIARWWMTATETTRHQAQRSHFITDRVRRAWRRRLERGGRAA